MSMPMEESCQAGGDSTDSFPVFDAPRQYAPSPPPPASYATESYRQLEDSHFEYHMKHQSRGMAIIINNEKFNPETQMGDRNGSSVDRDNLVKSLKFIGFRNSDIIVQDNLKGKLMIDLLTKVAGQDHRNNDCLFVAILSHGDEANVYGTDRPVPYDSLIAPIRDSKTLVGKPKIFVVQACRGEKLDGGVMIQHDAGPPQAKPKTYFISKESDILLAYSVVPGYYSWRNCSNGSWFIQALSEVIQADGRRLEFVRLLTRVNRLVSYTFKSNASSFHMTNKKQSPCIMSMLTKDLYFA